MKRTFEELRTKAAGCWTLSPTAEHHAGMQISGNPDHVPIPASTASSVASWFESQGYIAMNVDLSDATGVPVDGGVLHVKNGASRLCDVNRMWATFIGLPKDTQYLDRGGKIRNKHKRSNVNVGEHAESADIASGVGTTVAFSSAPEVSKLLRGLTQFGGGLEQIEVAEGNFYHTPVQCGIGLHGDSERKFAVGVSMGSTRYLEFQSFVHGFPSGPAVRLTLEHGDLYIMYGKGCGYDWDRIPLVGELPSGSPRRAYHAPHVRHRAGDSGFLEKNRREDLTKWLKRIRGLMQSHQGNHPEWFSNACAGMQHTLAAAASPKQQWKKDVIRDMKLIVEQRL